MGRSTPLALLLGLTVSATSVGCDGGPATEPEFEPFPQTAPPPSPLLRLTQAQYRNTLRDVFGGDLVLPTQLEPDVDAEGLAAVGASLTTVSPRGVEQYESASYDVAQQVMAPGPMRDALVACEPSSKSDRGCAADVLRELGRRLWRRPLKDGEVESLVDVSVSAGETLDDFYLGLEFGVAALLQSPNFLFRAELGSGDGDTLELSSYQMASRLSFFLWNAGPDLELLDAAERGELVDDESLRLQAERLLESPRSREAVRAYFADLLDLDQLDTLSKDTVVFTHMSPDLGAFSREETLRLIEHWVFDEDGDYRDLFTTRTTFLNRKLASVYNVPAPALDGFGEYQWPKKSPRAGLLTQISFLASNSHPISSSATLRGKFVRRKLLCAEIPPPPAEVNTALPEPSGEARTLRERLAEHVANPVCKGCHDVMDPVGLGLENFDALGQYRELDNEVEIDASGELDGTPFANARDLGEAVASHPDLTPCMVTNLFRYALGRTEADEESALLGHLESRFEERDYRVRGLFMDIVMSPSFRMAAPPSDDEGEGQ